MNTTQDGDALAEEEKTVITVFAKNRPGTIMYKDGTRLGGVMIHPGRDPVTGEGGGTEGCFVTDKPTYEQLHKLLLENTNNNGKAYFHLLPRKVSQ